MGKGVFGCWIHRYITSNLGKGILSLSDVAVQGTPLTGQVSTRSRDIGLERKKLVVGSFTLLTVHTTQYSEGASFIKHNKNNSPGKPPCIVAPTTSRILTEDTEAPQRCHRKIPYHTNFFSQEHSWLLTPPPPTRGCRKVMVCTILLPIF